MFKWILLFLTLAGFVVLSFTGPMLNSTLIIFAKAMLLILIVVTMLYFAKQAHIDEKPL